MLGLFKRNLVLASFLFFWISCYTLRASAQTQEANLKTDSKNQKRIAYLALGDSYTIGTGLNEGDLSYPIQLEKRLRSEFGIDCHTKIIAKNGWTTNDLIQAIKTESLDSAYALVSLLIGVNNQYQGDDIKNYITEFEQLLVTAISLAGNNTEKVFIISIPDYGVTPFGKENAEQIRQDINRYNALNDSIARAYNVSYFNITPISREASEDISLLAPDNLHPSGKMYTEWIDSFIEDVFRKVK